MDLDDVLLAVEKAAPVDAVEAVTRSIGVNLDASWVSFLVADMSGRALVRLIHAPIGQVSGARRLDEDIAMVLPFDGGPREQALRVQQVLDEDVGDQFVVRAPVTQLGKPTDCWRSLCPSHQRTRRCGGCRGRRTRWHSW
ncbi:MAG TPA: hypothetical protein VFH03_07615 [Actinoplanes sp.]|nr:hypothetical protein [Actinoplanes sp.]